MSSTTAQAAATLSSVEQDEHTSIEPALRRSISLENFLIVFLFSAVIFYGAFRAAEACINNKSSVTEQEARATKQMPKIHSLRKDLPLFAPAFEAFIIDHFPARCELTSLRNEILLKLLNSSGHADVGIGTNGWLYYFPVYVLQAQVNAPPFSRLNLALWTRAIEARQNFLKQHGIKYLLFIVPEKATIYPEYFAPGLKIRDGKSRLDELQEALAAEGNVDFIDLKAALKAHKKDAHLLYQKYDAHWNLYGALIAAKLIGSHIQRSYPAATFFNRNDFAISMKKSVMGDLASALALSYQLPEMLPEVDLGETYAKPIPKKSVPYAGLYHEGSYGFTKADDELPKVFMIHDSYVRYYMMPMIAELSRNVQFHWTQEFPTQRIVAQKPDLFIEEMAERHLFDTEPPNVPDMVKVVHKTEFPGATIGDGAGHPAIASFDDKVELVDAAISSNEDGYFAKFLWRADCSLSLNKAIEIRVLDKDGTEISKKHYQEDMLERKLAPGATWVDTIDLELKNLPEHATLAVVLLDPKSGAVPVQSKSVDWSSTRILVAIDSLCKNWNLFEQNYRRLQ